jgi:DNA-binding Lrp family transcriptional regulator
MDALDRQILYAVQVEPRAPFSDMAAVLGVSEQTVARRYRRLHAGGIVRVVGMLNPGPLGRTNWVVRVQVRPDAATSLADALAHRDDVSWVSLVSGGSEVVCVSHPASDDERDELLLQRLPRTSQVIGFGAQALLHRFGSDRGPDWTGYDNELTPEQQARLQRELPPVEAPVTLEPGDEALLAALARDGRASYAELAKATGWTASRTARRLDQLVGSGVAYLDVEMAPGPMGFHALAFLWLTVSPADIVATGEAVTRHPNVAFCGAITGGANIMAALVCRDSGDLYRYVTEQIGAIDTIRQVEISPVLRRVKQAGSLMSGGRLGSDARRPAGRMAGSGRGLTGS